MAEPKINRQTALTLVTAAAVLQTLVMIFLATDRLRSSVAVPLLAMVLIFGLLPAAIYIKSQSAR